MKQQEEDIINLPEMAANIFMRLEDTIRNKFQMKDILKIIRFGHSYFIENDHTSGKRVPEELVQEFRIADNDELMAYIYVRSAAENIKVSMADLEAIFEEGMKYKIEKGWAEEIPVNPKWN